jgi:hypothetical protein
MAPKREDRTVRRDDRGPRVRYALRASVLDRPGALSALTAALARVGADVVTLDVIDRVDGIAVDDLWVEADVDPPTLRRAVEQVPGVIVETLRGVDAFPDPGAPMALAAHVVERGKGAVRELVEGLPGALGASWCVAVASGLVGLDVLAGTDGAPDLSELSIPWLPLAAPRRLERAEWMPESWRAQVAEGLELAAAPLGPSPTALLIGRTRGPRFRSAELRQLGDLARIAVATEMHAAAAARPPRPPLTAPAGPAASAGMS